MKSQLQGLADPSKFQGPISIDGISPEILKSMLNSMSIIRKTEQQLAKGRQEGLIGGPVHLGVGQEAIAVGISQLLQKTDRVFGAHRSHSHLLALNPDFYRLFAEVLGKASGFSKGMGGSMHLFDQANGFFGSTPIVAGTASLAVGAAMAANLQNLNNVGVAYIGDGAVEEGVVHESFNLAKIQNAPVLFAIENNLFSSHMHISLRQPNDKISRFAEANEIPYELVDGNDVVAVFSAAKKQISDMREGKGPRLLELITYRWYGHVDWREDVDVGVNRSTEDLENWKLRDPLKRLCDSMIKKGIWSKEEHDKLDKEIDDKIFKAWNKAIKDDYPHRSSTLKYVYSEQNQEDI
jgi:TPP-dependent pyruvate/acetoin dehydrogenase alpha subunit